MSEVKQLNELISQHVYSDELAASYEKIYEDLEPSQARPLNKLIWQVYRQEINLEVFWEKSRELSLSKFEEKIWLGILLADFFLIADYLKIKINDCLKFFSSADLPNFKIVSIKQWLAKYAEEEDLGSEDIIAVLQIALEKYLSGEIGKKETTSFLSDSDIFKNKGLTLENAKVILKDFDEKIQSCWENKEILTNQEIDLSKIPSAPLVAVAEVVVSPKKSSNQGLLRELSLPTAPVPTPVQTYYETAEEIIKKFGFSVVPDLVGRLKNIIVSGLKEVRKIIEVRERLLADIKVGGLGFKTEQVERVIQLIEEGKKKITSGQTVIKPQALVSSVIPTELSEAKRVEGSRDPSTKLGMTKNETGMTKNGSEEPKKVVAPPADLPSLDQLIETKELPPPPKPLAIVRPEAKLVMTSLKPLPPMPPTTSDIKEGHQEALKIVNQAKDLPKVEKITPPTPIKPPVTNAVPQTLQGRAKVEDVSFRLRLIGPIEELQEMNLVDFHRLSPKPKVAVDKLHTKMELLEKESYIKKVQGIQAWQKSPLNQIYLALLNEAMIKGVPVKQIIEIRKSAGKEFLTEEEFHEIMEFNRTLRY